MAPVGDMDSESTHRDTVLVRGSEKRRPVGTRTRTDNSRPFFSLSTRGLSAPVYKRYNDRVRLMRVPGTMTETGLSVGLFVILSERAGKQLRRSDQLRARLPGNSFGHNINRRASNVFHTR